MPLRPLDAGDVRLSLRSISRDRGTSWKPSPLSIIAATGDERQRWR